MWQGRVTKFFVLKIKFNYFFIKILKKSLLHLTRETMFSFYNYFLTDGKGLRSYSTIFSRIIRQLLTCRLLVEFVCLMRLQTNSFCCNLRTLSHKSESNCKGRGGKYVGTSILEEFVATFHFHDPVHSF